MERWTSAYRALPQATARYGIIGPGFTTRERADVCKGLWVEIEDAELVAYIKGTWTNSKHWDINPTAANCVCVVMPLG